MSIVLDSKTYTFSGWNQNQQALYSEKSGGVPSSFSYLTAKVNTGTGKSDSTVKWNLSIPIVATVDSECACAGDVLRTYYVRIEVTEPAGSTLAERENVHDCLTNLVAAPEFQSSIEGLVQPSS